MQAGEIAGNRFSINELPCRRQEMVRGECLRHVRMAHFYLTGR
jgi:hypothetical protein